MQFSEYIYFLHKIIRIFYYHWNKWFRNRSNYLVCTTTSVDCFDILKRERFLVWDKPTFSDAQLVIPKRVRNSLTFALKTYAHETPFWFHSSTHNSRPHETVALTALLTNKVSRGWYHACCLVSGLCWCLKCRWALEADTETLTPMSIQTIR